MFETYTAEGIEVTDESGVKTVLSTAKIQEIINLYEAKESAARSKKELFQVKLAACLAAS